MDEDKADQDQEEEWLRQSNLIYGGLLGVGIHSAGYTRLEQRGTFAS